MLQKGTTLAGYRIDAVLGQGGMGAVYEATQLSLQRVVALKLLASHLSDDVAFRERFRREGQIQARLEHPHIVTVYEAGETPHGLFIAMRLVRGVTLKDMIVARELDPARTLRILEPLAEALDEAHEQGLIHRDIKPQNVLVGRHDHAYLADFGLTKDVRDKSLTKTGYFLGTLDYVAPEQIRGEPTTGASDIYSLAGVLYECLTGVVPYVKDSEAAVLYSHVMDPPPRPSERRPELPRQLDDAIARGMAKEPHDRFATAGALIEAAGRALPAPTRTALAPPEPLATPQETGIRESEQHVPTRPSSRNGPPPVTKPEPAVALQHDVSTVISPARREAAQVEAREAATVAEAAPAARAAATPAAEAEPTVRAAATPAAETAPAVVTPSEPSAEPEPGVVIPPETRPAAAAPAPVAEIRPGAAPPGAATGAQARRAPTSRAPRLAAAGIALVAVVAVGFLLGRGLADDGSAPEPVERASAGVLSLQPPQAWTRSAEPAAIPGVELDDPVALEGEGGAMIAAGTYAAAGSSLLPASLSRRLGDSDPQPAAVRLGDVEAYRYDALRDGDRTLRLYAAPTSAGVAAVVCSAPASAAARVAPDCDRAAASLRLRAAKAFPVGPDTAYAKELADAIGPLNKAGVAGSRRLRDAKRARAQATIAGQLSGMYAAAAKKLHGAAGTPLVAGTNQDVVRALGRVGGGYRRLAAAARGNRAAAYGRARRDLRSALARLRRAVEAAGRSASAS